jgi:uncharacterized hydrophobic protein (TIGR00341 family)
MKKILIHARAEDLQKLEPLLEGLYYITVHEGDAPLITLYAPEEELDSLISTLTPALDMRFKESLIEVTSPDFVISSYLKRRAKESGEKKEKTPVEEVLESAHEHSRIDKSKIALTSIAGIIALSGLFLNNSAIIIGAMLLSPILGPIYGFAINTALGQTKDALRSISALGLLLGSVFLLSAITTFVIGSFIDLPLTDEILSRTVVNPIYILMAILLGFASILAFVRGMSDIIAGVAIAAALLPPTVVAGIAVVMYQVSTLYALVLVFENVIGLMAGALIATLVLDIAPRKNQEQIAAKKYVLQTAAVIALLLGLLLAILLFM